MQSQDASRVTSLKVIQVLRDDPADCQSEAQAARQTCQLSEEAGEAEAATPFRRFGAQRALPFYVRRPLPAATPL